MNTLQFNFTIAFLKRNRALLEVATEEQIQEIIDQAGCAFRNDNYSPYIKLWFQERYKEWAEDFCKDEPYNTDIRAALLHD